MQTVLEMSLGAQKCHAFLSLHVEMLADNPGGNLALPSGTTIQRSMLGGFGLGLGMPF